MRDISGGRAKAWAEALHDLPFVSDLWGTLAAKLKTSPVFLVDQLKYFQAEGLIREIGPLFNLEPLGYRSTLVAGAVPSDRIDAVADIVSAHPGVSHNYLREGSEYNLWFTLAAAGSEPLARELENLSAAAHVSFRRFDTVVRYKISFQFSQTSSEPDPGNAIPVASLDETKRNLYSSTVEILQQGLRLEPFPFRRLAAGTRLSESDLLQAGDQMRRSGILRRFGVVWRHRQMGLTENVLCLWQLPEDGIDSFSKQVRQIPQITHCYRRMTYPDWPWQVYTMIHGTTQESCRQVIDQLHTAFPESQYLPLRTAKEFKKSRVFYKL